MKHEFLLRVLEPVRYRSFSELMDELGLDLPTVRRMVRAAERDGYVEVYGSTVYITKRGRDALQAREAIMSLPELGK